MTETPTQRFRTFLRDFGRAVGLSGVAVGGPFLIAPTWRTAVTISLFSLALAIGLGLSDSGKEGA